MFSTTQSWILKGLFEGSPSRRMPGPHVETCALHVLIPEGPKRGEHISIVFGKDGTTYNVGG